MYTTKTIVKINLAIIASSATFPLFAAQSIDLKAQDIGMIRGLAVSGLAASVQPDAIKELSQAHDAKNTLHVRTQQTYRGYRVWGGEAIVHIPKGKQVKNNLTALIAQSKTKGSSVNGVIYKSLDKDLQTAPTIVFSDAQKEKAFASVLTDLQKETHTNITPENISNELIVFVDANQKAHWAYFIQFTAAKTQFSEPSYIVDAVSFDVYNKWNNLMSREVIGTGGNPKTGPLIYDNHPNNFPSLRVYKNTAKNTCNLIDYAETVQIREGGDPGGSSSERYGVIYETTCPDDPIHLNDSYHPINDPVSKLTSTPYRDAKFPELDAYYATLQVIKMYQDRYQIPAAYSGSNEPIKTMVMHVNSTFDKNGENAQFNSRYNQIYIGAGGWNLFPLATLGVIAHEMGHAFTNGQSQLVYLGESGAMNEAFSDMADQAIYAHFYGKQDIYGHKSWQIGAEVSQWGPPLRYMDQPRLNCDKPAKECPVDNMKQYKEYLNVHIGSGIYNRAFYLLATAEGWDVLKAFDVMVQANRFYWTNRSTFKAGACGVISAAKDLNYDKTAIVNAYKAVGIDVTDCA